MLQNKPFSEPKLFQQKAIKSQKFFKGVNSIAEKVDFFMKQADANIEKGESKDSKAGEDDKLLLSDFCKFLSTTWRFDPMRYQLFSFKNK